MTRREQFICVVAYSVITSTIVTIGIEAWGWLPDLLFVVPAVGGSVMLAAYEFVVRDRLARWRIERARRRGVPPPPGLPSPPGLV